MPSGETKVCRIASFSGYMGDRFDALKTQAESSGAGILFGDYLAEMVSCLRTYYLLCTYTRYTHADSSKRTSLGGRSSSASSRSWGTRPISLRTSS